VPNVRATDGHSKKDHERKHTYRIALLKFCFTYLKIKLSIIFRGIPMTVWRFLHVGFLSDSPACSHLRPSPIPGDVPQHAFANLRHWFHGLRGRLLSELPAKKCSFTVTNVPTTYDHHPCINSGFTAESLGPLVGESAYSITFQTCARVMGGLNALNWPTGTLYKASLSATVDQQFQSQPATG
jgi:hypothetical protein